YIYSFFFSSRRRHTRFSRDWSSDVCSSDLTELNDLVQGDNPSMQIQQAFRNPQTGQFDRGQLNNFISQVGTLPQGHEAHAQWDEIGRASCRERGKSTEVDVERNKKNNDRRR